MSDVIDRRGRLVVAVALVLAAITVAVLLVFTLFSMRDAGILGDLEIYRGAIGFALGGGDLYQWVYQHPVVHGLGFTYPPFSALVLSWLTVLPLGVAKAVWIVLTLAVAAACLQLLVTAAGERSWPGSAPTASVRWAWTAGLAIPFLLTYPFVHDLVVGQVTLFVVALALFDQQLPRRWRGVLVGLAAAIKLTPLVFIPYYLITRQWRAAILATATFAAAGAVAFLVLPGPSINFWTSTLWQTGRVGRTDSTVNKSLLGMLTRLFSDTTAVHVLWLVVAVAVVVLAFWQASRAYRDGDLVGASLMVGMLSVAVSPISWPHHALWLSLVACWWLLQRGRLPALLSAVLFAVLFAYPLYDDYPSTAAALSVGVEIPVLAVLLVLGFGSRPGEAVTARTS